jgi:hypothetical protein
VKRVLTVVVAGSVALAATAVALAGSSSALLGEYAGVGGQTQREVPLSAQAGVQTSGNLPFTGLDLALIALGALLLLLTGWMIRRAGRDKA